MESPGSSQASNGNSDARFHTRSRNGCFTCRTKKVKCDETRPQCCRCTRLKLLCDYNPRAKRKYTKFIGSKKPKQASGGQLWSSCVRQVLPGPMSSASSLDLSSADHESIRYYRTTIARIYHTKNPEYSLYAITFHLAQREPMIMHMVLALAGQEVEYRRRSIPAYTTGSLLSRRNASPLDHYSAALRLMAESLDQAHTDDAEEKYDLDIILATLHLMILYERHHGDERCRGLSNHLTGASRVIQHHFRNCTNRILLVDSPNQSDISALTQPRSCENQTPPNLSLFSARMLLHLAAHDTCATSFGIGGQLIEVLNEAFLGDDTNFSSLDALQRFSNSLYSVMWGERYPQAELLDDLGNRAIFALVAAAAHVRFLVSKLRKVKEEDNISEKVGEIQRTIQLIQFRFTELLADANDLPMSMDNSNRLMANYRDIVPQYFATQIEFDRARRDLGLQVDSSTECLVQGILNLASQSYNHQGDEGLLRISYPLYIAALETDNVTNRDWILARFQRFGAYSGNLERAYRFLLRAVANNNNHNTNHSSNSIHSRYAELFVL